MSETQLSESTESTEAKPAVTKEDFVFETKATQPPPPEPVHFFKCSKGHEQLGSGALGLERPGSGKPYFMSGNICKACVWTWQAERFPTHRTSRVYEPAHATQFDFSSAEVIPDPEPANDQE